MKRLDQVVLFNIATMLDLDNLLSFCSSSERINRLICQGEAIWLFKLKKEFPDWEKYLNMNPREAYELLISLTKLKKELNYYEGTIYNLYKETSLDLHGEGITSLSPEIGKLINLQSLNLNHNKITLLPPEIGKLINLQSLSLNHNKITLLPPEIGNLKQLQKLYLYNNRLTSLPPEIGNLKQLITLDLENNLLNSLPMEISKLDRLQGHLHLDKTVSLPLELKQLLTPQLPSIPTLF